MYEIVLSVCCKTSQSTSTSIPMPSKGRCLNFVSALHHMHDSIWNDAFKSVAKDCFKFHFKWAKVSRLDTMWDCLGFLKVCEIFGGFLKDCEFFEGFLKVIQNRATNFQKTCFLLVLAHRMQAQILKYFVKLAFLCHFENFLSPLVMAKKGSFWAKTTNFGGKQAWKVVFTVQPQNSRYARVFNIFYSKF